MFAGHNLGKSIRRSVSNTGGANSQPTIIVNNFLDGEQIRGHLVKTLTKNQGGFR